MFIIVTYCLNPLQNSSPVRVSGRGAVRQTISSAGNSVNYTLTAALQNPRMQQPPVRCMLRRLSQQCNAASRSPSTAPGAPACLHGQVSAAAACRCPPLSHSAAVVVTPKKIRPCLSQNSTSLHDSSDSSDTVPRPSSAPSASPAHVHPPPPPPCFPSHPTSRLQVVSGRPIFEPRPRTPLTPREQVRHRRRVRVTV